MTRMRYSREKGKAEFRNGRHKETACFGYGGTAVVQMLRFVSRIFCAHDTVFWVTLHTLPVGLTATKN